MAEGPRAPLPRSEAGALMGTTIPPESKSQPASRRDEDPHESVTIAPPAPNIDDMWTQATPVPSPSSRGDEHFRAALDAGARAGMSLTQLSKMIAELTGGMLGARQANEQLVQELATLRAMLGSSSEQQLILRDRVTTLEDELSAIREAARRDRDFLTEEHDTFLAGLLEEHEQALEAAQGAAQEHLHAAEQRSKDSSELETLARKLAEAEAGRLQLEAERELACETRLLLTGQRDDAQARAEKRERERDELRAEASRLRAQLGSARTISTSPPPVGVARPPSFRPAAALELDAGELDVTLRSRPPGARLPSSVPRLSPPPAELRQALHTPRPPSFTPRPPSFTPRPPSFTPRPGSVSTAPREPYSDSVRPSPRISTQPGVGEQRALSVSHSPAIPPRPNRATPSPPGSFGPPPSGQTPRSPELSPRPTSTSAASLPPARPSDSPPLKQKPDPLTRPLIGYSLGVDGVRSETLEGASFPSKPPQKR